jgi:hypothetical protein
MPIGMLELAVFFGAGPGQRPSPKAVKKKNEGGEEEMMMMMMMMMMMD